MIEIKTSLESFLAFLEGRFTWSFGDDVRKSLGWVGPIEQRLFAAMTFATQGAAPLAQTGAEIPNPDMQDPCWSDETSFAGL